MTGAREDKLSQKQKEAKSELEGMRSLAAWDASSYGLAIKISEDGPISLFKDNLPIGEYG